MPADTSIPLKIIPSWPSLLPSLTALLWILTGAFILLSKIRCQPHLTEKTCLGGSQIDFWIIINQKKPVLDISCCGYLLYHAP